jgi:hypothetical protein
MSAAFGGVLLISLLAGCETPPPITLENNVNLRGFSTFPTPRTFDGPGTLFRIDKDGTKFPVAKLAIPVEVVGNEVFANYTRETSWSLGGFLKFVGAIRVLSDAQLSANMESTVNLTLQIGQGDRERTYDNEIAAALKDASVKYRGDSRYYVIRETIAVREISYNLTRGNNSLSTITVSINKAIDGSGSLKWVDSRQSELKQTFDQPHRVFYTVEEVLPSGTGFFGGEPKRIRVYEPLQWRIENH